MKDKLQCCVCFKTFDLDVPVTEIEKHLKTHSFIELFTTVFWNKLVGDIEVEEK